jgi:hypothetical protein
MRESRKRYALFAELVLSFVAALCLSEDSVGQVKPRSPAENWVAQLIEAGKIADLTESPYKDTPILSASFLQKLLSETPKNKPNPYSVTIKNATIVDFVDLGGMEIPFDLTLENCVFEGSLNCYLTQFKRNLFLSGTRFKSGVKFTYAEVSNILIANNAQFENPDQRAQFDSIKVGRDAFFTRAIFNGPVDFGFASIAGDLVAQGAQFKSDQDAFFNNMKVGGGIYLAEYIIFKSEGEEDGVAYCEYGDPKKKQSSCFNGNVDFRFTNVGGNFDADGSHFEKVSEKITLLCDAMIVSGHFFLRRTCVRGVADFHRMHTGGNFEVSKTRFEQPPSFLSVHVGDTAYFNGTNISGLARFEDMRYQTIAGDQLEDLFSNHSEYKPDVYSNLEEVFRRHAEIDKANSFYIVGRKKQRSDDWQKNKSLWGAIKWAWNFVQDKVAGYGRHLENALVWSVGFIIVGCIVFWKEKWMETQSAQEAARYQGRYRPIWYSISLFMPIIDLPDKKIWMPQSDRRLRRLYMRVHIILGYLLIPIGIAAWTGLIK